MKKEITRELKSNKGYCKFCSSKCSHLQQNHSVITTCVSCGKQITKKLSKIKKSKYSFCSNSCTTLYYNSHKTHGNSRSKLELYIEKQLKSLYPNLEMLFNDRKTILSELDIYIPTLRLAFELNGIFHYEPIFGDTQLNKVIDNDKNKFKLCHENQIGLCVLDTSKQKRFTEKSSKEFVDIILTIISDNLTV